MSLLDDSYLFPDASRAAWIARDLYMQIRDQPLVCPHGHCDPAWFATNAAFSNPTDLIVTPDHYIFRMLHSQGIDLDRLGIAHADGTRPETDPEEVWSIFAAHYHLFRGTPTRDWLDYTFATVFGLDERLTPETASGIYKTLSDRLATDAFRPRALFDRFNIEVLATTESPLDDLSHHRAIRDSDWPGRVVTTYRPDPVVDPDFVTFADNLRTFGEITGCDPGSWQGYLEAHRKRRAFFAEHGATATDHGHPTAATANLSAQAASLLYDKIRTGHGEPQERELFRAQMLTEMAKMSVEDGLVMQIHPGSYRNHSRAVFERFGRDKGFDIPQRTDYVHALKPLLDAVGHEKDLSIILFTLDETAYSRELAPLAGVYPCLKLGPAWWFFDSAEGMMRYRSLTTETAGFYNTVGFNDDTRAFPSIPARHDLARRVDCIFLGELVAAKRLTMDEARELAGDLANGLARKAYRF